MNTENPHVPKGIIEEYDRQIAECEKIIKVYTEVRDKFLMAKKMMIESPPPQVHFFQREPKITRDFARKFLQQINKPVKTAEIIEMTYGNATEDVKSKAIKTLSVVLNILASEGEIKMEKQKGVKGNYYTWIRK